MPHLPKEPKRPWKPDKEKTANNNEPDAFLKSTGWRKLKKSFLADNPICVRCKLRNRIREAKVVDHIVPRAVEPDKALDRNNLQALCVIHHNKKTQEDRVNYDIG